MSIKERVQEEIKNAMRNKDTVRLECLRLAKGALLLKEKESAEALTDESAIQSLRAEIKKRQQSIDIYKQLEKQDEVDKINKEIATLEEFLPRQWSAEETEAQIRAYLNDHPDLNHAGKLTGAIKKEYGDLVDGKILNELCRKVLGA